MISAQILLVDDERQVTDALQRELRSFCVEEQVTIVVASSSRDALEVLRDQGEFAVLMCDINMPGLKGHDLLSLVAQRYPDTVTLILTGNPEVGSLRDYLEAHLFSLLQKPWDRDVLKVEFRRALKTWRARVAKRLVVEAAEREQGLASAFAERLRAPVLPKMDGLELEILPTTGAADRTLVVVAPENRGVAPWALVEYAGNASQRAYLAGWLQAELSRGLDTADFASVGPMLATGSESMTIRLTTGQIDGPHQLVRWSVREYPGVTQTAPFSETALPAGGLLWLSSGGVSATGPAEAVVNLVIRRAD